MRVNAVAPGPVRTAGTEFLLGDTVDTLGRMKIRGRVGEPGEIAEIVLFLVDRSSYVNGAQFRKRRSAILYAGGESGLRRFWCHPTRRHHGDPEPIPPSDSRFVRCVADASRPG